MQEADVRKINVLNHFWYEVNYGDRRFIRKSMWGVKTLIKKLKDEGGVSKSEGN